MPADVSEVFKLAADLKVNRIGKDVSAAVRAAGKELQADMKARAPKRTGDLAGSIAITTSGGGSSSGMSVTVRAEKHYGFFNEYGTSKMAANPFGAPAAEAATGPFVAKVTDAAGKVLG